MQQHYRERLLQWSFWLKLLRFEYNLADYARGVQQQLKSAGIRAEVDTQDAKARVQALTDAEVAELNARMAELPAGGDVLAVVLIIFLVFVNSSVTSL